MTTQQRGAVDRPRPTRVTLLIALAIGAVYLLWRVGWTRGGTNPVLFWRLWVVEVMIWVGLARSAYDGWSLRSDRRRPDDGERTVDVLVLCRDEPLEVLRATLAGCDALARPHRTVVIDTVGRRDLAVSAQRLGFDMVRTGLGATASVDVVLNTVLPGLGGDLFTVLAGDQVPLPDMLDELVGDFADEGVWLAQGRQAVYGPSPGEYRRGAVELELFFRVVLPGENHHGGAYWCGSGGVVRRATVDALGGVPSSTDTPEFQLSLAATRAGWRSTYHSRAAVMTLARPDVDGFIGQRSLLAHGHLQSLRTRDCPLFAPGYSLPQRLSYLGTIYTYLSGPRRLALIWILCATLLSGALPLRADPVLLAAMWCTWMAALALSNRLLGRGAAGTTTTVRHRWLLIGAYVTAWLGLLVPRRVVAALRNPPAAAGTGAVPTSRLRLLVASTTAVVVCGLARLADLFGLVDLPAMPRTAAWIVVAVAVVLAGSLVHLLVDTSRRTRRLTPRFSVEATAQVGAVPHRLLDLAEGGASVRFDRPPKVGCPYVVALHIPGLDGGTHQATVAAEVRSVRRMEGAAGAGYAVGMAFTHLSSSARERITEYCRVLLPARIAAGEPATDGQPHGRRAGRRAGAGADGVGPFDESRAG